MKLRTELYPNRISGMSFGYDDESLKHDAYAAHALVMAMSESANLDSDSMWEDERERVFRRANEILETWGYEE